MTRFEHVSSLAEVRERRPTVLAIGVFDGLHRGHQQLLQQMLAAAQAIEARVAVLTFFPHPAEVIRGAAERYYLTTPEERTRLLAAQGIELLITHPFDHTIRQTRAADFMQQLCAALDLRQLWGGHFSIGYQREGTFEYLSDLGARLGFSVQRVTDLMWLDGERVSSSRIRRGLQAGEMADVTACLGRLFGLSGEVVAGRRLGQTLGFPTANLRVWERQMLPAHGVYATYAWVGDQRYTAATNVGVRPTVDGYHLTVEAHLLDFSGDLYAQPLRLEFVQRLRPELKFASLDALKAQISADIAAIRALHL